MFEKWKPQEQDFRKTWGRKGNAYLIEVCLGIAKVILAMPDMRSAFSGPAI